MDRRLSGVALCVLLAGGSVLRSSAAAKDESASPPRRIVLEFDRPQTAGICGFRAMWDRPVVLVEDAPVEFVDRLWKDRGGRAVWSGAKPAAMAFDALHRSMLVRFPGSAEKIAAQQRKGYAIRKAELVLELRDTELWPPGDPNYPPPRGGYHYRSNWGVDRLYRKRAPRWHAVAWALRRPWTADAKLGPTYNAFVHGAGYWAKYGAADAHTDRFAARFGPTEVSSERKVGRMDITAVLTDEAFGKSPAERLRTLAVCGLVVL